MEPAFRQTHQRHKLDHGRLARLGEAHLVGWGPAIAAARRSSQR